jgi:transposase InsO family protein
MALIDSGAGGNFIDEETVTKLQLQRTELRRPIQVRNVDGTLNHKGQITHRSILEVTIANRRQWISFLITGLGKQHVILGLPWLIKENPDINWHQGILQWRPTPLLIVGDNDDKKGGDFTTSASYIDALAETYEETTNISTLEILKVKLSDYFNQIYGDDDKKDKTPEELVPSTYHKYLRLFSKKASERYPEPRPYDHEIHLKPDFKPSKRSPYSLNPTQMDLAKTFIDENLKKGYITKSTSSMASPLFFVGKKDGSSRPCQDYRQLNEGTIKDAFPLPNINDLLRDLQGAKYFTKLDIRWGYNNIQIKPEDRPKAAFSTPFGLYEPTVMFFGLCNSPATFQRMMNHIFWAEINEGWCKVYMDDILIAAFTIEELIERTLRILKIIEENDLFLKPEKCEFEQLKVDYLGYIISHNRIEMDPKKLAGISDWPYPKNLRQVRSFLGFGNFYRRFIYRFSHIVRPLTALTKKDRPFEWTTECIQAFEELKKRFLEAPILMMPDQDQPFYLETDASGFASGAVLMQKDINGHLHSCGYLSRTFSETEQRYQIYDRELLALIRALEEWKVYLEGARHPVTVYTDHSNLKYFRSGQTLNGRQARWSLFLSQFPLQLVHKPGKTMILSDSLSRRADAEESKEKDRTAVLLPDDLFVQILDMEFSKTLAKIKDSEYDQSVLKRLRYLLTEPDNEDPDWKVVKDNGQPIILYQNRKYVPRNNALRRELLRQYHDHETAGHPGAPTTYFLLSRDYWWPGITTYVKQYVKGCGKCQQYKINRHPWKGPLRPIAGPQTPNPFTQISMDLLTDLPVSEDGYDTLLVVVDHGLSKGLVLTPTHKTVTSIGIAELLRDNVFKRYGIANTLISDRDPRFTSIVFQEWLRLLGIKSALSTAYHPQSDGATERVMQEIQAYLSIYCIANPSDWTSSISLLEFVHNSRPHADRKQSPFELIMGYQPRGTPQTFLPSRVPNLEERMELLKQWRKDAQLAHEIARERMTKRILLPTERFTENQKVWLDTRNFSTMYNKKIRPKREGPFKVKKVLGPVTYQLELPKTWKVHNVFHSIHLSPYNETSQHGPNETRPPPDLVDNEEEYEVDFIVRHKRNNKGQLLFLIRWKGYGPHEDSWEPATNLKSAKETLDEYKRREKLA